MEYIYSVITPVAILERLSLALFKALAMILALQWVNTNKSKVLVYFRKNPEDR